MVEYVYDAADPLQIYMLVRDLAIEAHETMDQGTDAKYLEAEDHRSHTCCIFILQEETEQH